MALYTIGDLHLSLGAQKPMDIFGGAWENYVAKISENWNSVVNENDTVVLLGDSSWGISLEQSRDDFLFINGLPGKKIIIKGNHDYFWTTLSKMNSFVKTIGADTISFINNNCAYYNGDKRIAICGTRGWFYEETGGDKIYKRELARLENSLASAEAGCEKYAFLHYPPITDGYECNAVTEILERHFVRHCFYGHLHGRAYRDTPASFSRRGVCYHLASADYLKFKPLFIEN